MRMRFLPVDPSSVLICIACRSGVGRQRQRLHRSSRSRVAAPRCCRADSTSRRKRRPSRTRRGPSSCFCTAAASRAPTTSLQVNANIDNLLAEAKRRGAFLYAPQTSSNWSGDTITDRVMAMIDRAIAELNADDRRLYVTGLSNGGGGTWNMLSRYDNRFAAAIPICGVSAGGRLCPGAIDRRRDRRVSRPRRQRRIRQRRVATSSISILGAARRTDADLPHHQPIPPVFELYRNSN